MGGGGSRCEFRKTDLAKKKKVWARCSEGAQPVENLLETRLTHAACDLVTLSQIVWGKSFAEMKGRRCLPPFDDEAALGRCSDMLRFCNRWTVDAWARNLVQISLRMNEPLRAGLGPCVA